VAPLLASLGDISANSYGFDSYQPVFGNYYSLATATVDSSGVSSITLGTGGTIPQNYTHLQIRAIHQYGVALDLLKIQLNGDTGANYSSHKMFGSGSGTGNSGSSINSTFIDIGYVQSSTSVFGTQIIDILDYTNVNKAKTVYSIAGGDLNGSGYVFVNSGGWYANTSGVYYGINSIKLYPDAGSFSQYTQFALYGVK